MSSDPPGYELPLRLLFAFRSLIDDLHAELAKQGHPGLRPMHGFVFQAIGPSGTTAVELGRTLGVTKQAAGKTIDTLERLGYVHRERDPEDGRRMLVRLTDHGLDCLTKSAQIFDQLRAEWAETLGAGRLRSMEEDLRKVASPESARLDLPGWFSGH
ncbi:MULTISPECIES: MarR family winged helix-turn-helix transcriptional regulator [unclassified Amycolatopsis]|uniref:MarR family winged helix-turn-helix transcriptional regulator n=1 Tax=unclassified Amycolatopsis TaxID=2618356 RepID=UPI001EE8BB8D|nr:MULTISPECIES: MarR family winged helix-turn-helix transcriptional regulator [unclassified Amycolatopsis]MCG3757174.1 winged helix-turn-helix transcriptional regulator [Amycolatopsis sp. Poz14]